MIVDGLVRGQPVFAVVGFPRTAEARLITRANPELRLLKVDGFRPGIERPLDTLCEISAVILAGGHVPDVVVGTVLQWLAVFIALPLVLVIEAIPSAVEVVFVVSPGNAGHHLSAVAMAAPAFQSGREAGTDAVTDGHIGIDGGARRPGGVCLERQSPVCVARFIRSDVCFRTPYSKHEAGTEQVRLE